MRLAADQDRVNGLGAEVIAISVDDEGRQAGMADRWRLRFTSLVSDPGGERYLQPLELWDPESRGGIALPGIVVIDPEGNERYRYQGRDFADRTTDDEIFAALEDLGLTAVEPEVVEHSAEVPGDLKGYFRPDDYGPYYRGNRFAAIAIGGRLPSKETAAVARQHRLMAEASLEAWDRHSQATD